MKFEIRSLADVPPPNKKDAYTDVIAAFNALPQGKALYVEADDKHNPRGIQSSLRRRLGKAIVACRADERGVWVWRAGEVPTETAAPSAAARPLAAAANGARHA